MKNFSEPPVISAKTLYDTRSWAEVTVHFPGGGHVRTAGRIRRTVSQSGNNPSIWINNICLPEDTPLYDYQKDDEYGVFYS